MRFTSNRIFYQMAENVQTSSIHLWQVKVVRRSHLTGFAQEVYGVLGLQKGCRCEAVVECQIAICVSLRLEQRSSCLVRCLLQSKYYNICERELSQHINTAANRVQHRESWESRVWCSYYVHAFGFLTGIRSLTVLACTSTSLKACLGSKNLLSILSGATKPGEEKKQN